MTYPIPVNEFERLETLRDYRILDSDFDERFDSLAAIASNHFGTPIALVSLVDDNRQWFKAVVGLDLRQTRRSDAFCNHAIASPDAVMVIEDATLDPRFSAKPLVTGAPHIRFYAGAPIVAEGGAAVGTVCVIDRVPRRFSEADRHMLMRLADHALALMDLHRRNILLREAAERDALTGLVNLRGLEKAIDRAVSATLGGQTCGLLYCDLDQFKQVNTASGHAAGDVVLRETARRLQSAVRQGDLVARVGGDEFVVLLAHPVDQSVVDLIAQRIQHGCMAPVMVNGQPVSVTLSIGAARAPRDAILGSDLLREADRALHASKRSGASRFVIAGSRGIPAAGGEDLASSELAHAIAHDELFLEWQSCHDIATGAVSSYEALVRWQHPRLGLIAPVNFVPLAEASGLSGQLDAWVLFNACNQAAAAPADAQFSVNLSGQWIANGNVLPLVRAALERSGLEPARLTLEITESSTIGDEQQARGHMNELKALGVKLALDDFGTGYSSLAYLQRYPFDLIKLDHGFVAGIGTEPRGARLAEAVIRLAEMIDIGVIAEGIETPAQAELLRSIGCRLGQGYLWARPRRTPWADPAPRPAA